MCIDECVALASAEFAVLIVVVCTYNSFYFCFLLIQGSVGYILEATGNYMTLHNVQKELETLEATCRSYIYDHNVSGGTRFLFLNKNDPEDLVTFKRLKGGDFAVNLVTELPSLEDKAEIEFLGTLSSQLKLFKNEHLPYIHGSKALKVQAEFGCIYAENISLLFSTASQVESTFSENADAKNQYGKAKKQRKIKHKFVRFSGRADSWSVAFPSTVLVSTKGTYTLGIKAAKNQTLTFVFDENLNFCDVEIPPINWVVADVKAPRPVNARSRDTDFRLTVCSERKLVTKDEKEDVMTSADYARFKSAIRKSSKAGSALELAAEHHKKVEFVRHDKTSVYKVLGSEVFIEEKEVEKYIVKRSRFLNNPKNFSEVKICGDFDGIDCAMEHAAKIAREVWEAAKRIQPHING